MFPPCSGCAGLPERSCFCTISMQAPHFTSHRALAQLLTAEVCNWKKKKKKKKKKDTCPCSQRGNKAEW